MTATSSARAAIEALFYSTFELPDLALAELKPLEIPRNLDTAILADASVAWPFESFVWYAGTDTQGVQRIFRFKRGDTQEAWHAALSLQRLQSVRGPYRTQSLARPKV
jgi:hypothetical protein